MPGFCHCQSQRLQSSRAPTLRCSSPCSCREVHNASDRQHTRETRHAGRSIIAYDRRRTTLEKPKARQLQCEPCKHSIEAAACQKGLVTQGKHAEGPPEPERAWATGNGLRATQPPPLQTTWCHEYTRAHTHQYVRLVEDGTQHACACSAPA